MSSPKYKLVVSDLDGTLLVNSHLPEFNLNSIKKNKRKRSKILYCNRKNNSINKIYFKRI